MVHRKPEEKAGIRAEMKNSTKSDRKNAKKSCLYQEMIGRPSQSIKGGCELKKKLKRSKSLKVSDWDGIRSPANQEKDGIKESGVHVDAVMKQPTAKMEDRLPNYMKPTTCSDKRKENTQVSAHAKTSNRNKSARDLNFECKRNSKLVNNLANPPSVSEGMKTLKRSSSLKPVKPPLKPLKRSSSLKPLKSSMRLTKPSTKAAGFPIYSVQDTHITRATCSSALKDSSFPDYIALNLGSTESEGTSLIKVCPYTYCSLNGHHHKPLPPLKHFISARRRLVKNQKSSKMKGYTPCKIKNGKEGEKEIDTGQKLSPVRHQRIPDEYILGSPRLSHSGDEEQITLFMEDWDVEFFVEIHVNSLPDFTDFEDDENGDITKRSSFDADQTIDKKTEAKDFGEPSVITHEDVTLEFGDEMVVETDEDFSQEAESVTDGSRCERSFDQDDNDDDQQDQSRSFLVSDAEAAISYPQMQHVEESESSVQVDQPATVTETCLWNDSAEQGVISEATKEEEVNDEACIISETFNNEVPDEECDQETTNPDIALMYDEDISGEENSILFSPVTPSDCTEGTVTASTEDCNDIPGNFILGDPSSQGDKPNLPMEETHTEITEVIDLHSTDFWTMDYENEIPELRDGLSEGGDAFAVGDLRYKTNDEIENLSVDIPFFEGDEITTTMEEIQSLQTEVNEAIDCQTTETDNREPKRNGAFSPCYESNDEHGAGEILRGVDEAQTAHESQNYPDMQPMDDGISYEHQDDLVANEAIVECISSSSLATLDTMEEAKFNNYDQSDDPNKEVLNTLQPTSEQKKTKVAEEHEKTIAGVDNQNLMVEGTEFVHIDATKEKNGYCEGSTNSVYDEEECNTMAVVNQAFQGEPESKTSDGKNSRGETIHSSLQVKDAMVQTEDDIEQHLKKAALGAKIKFPAEDEIENTRINMTNNSSGKEEIGSVMKANQARMHEASIIQPLISSGSHIQIVKGKRNDTAENTDEEKFNPRDPNFLPIEPDSDPEKVDLRHQMMDDKRNTEEWMVDYALRQAVNKLAPARKKKVALLVEAFETVLPLPKCETRAHRSAMSFSHVRPIQACR